MNNNYQDPNGQFQPYGQQPYGQQPYGQQPQYGQQPYGQPPFNNQFRNQRPVPQGPAPGNTKAGIGLVCGISSIVLSVFGVLPSFVSYADKFVERGGKWYFEGSRPSPVLAVILAVVTLALAITGLVLSVSGGSENQRAGFRRGGLSVTGMVFGIIAIVITAIGFACVGCSTAVIERAAESRYLSIY